MLKRVRSLLLWGGILSFYSVNAQKPKDFYVSYPQSGGTLYHIFPISFFEHETDGNLTLDITCQCNKDSAIINFTYYAPHTELLDSVNFRAGKIYLTGKAEKFFIEPETTKRWAHRYSLHVPIQSLYSFFNLKALPNVTLYVNSTKKEYELKKSEWSKKAPVIRTILKTIHIDCNK